MVIDSKIGKENGPIFQDDNIKSFIQSAVSRIKIKNQNYWMQKFKC